LAPVFLAEAFFVEVFFVEVFTEVFFAEVFFGAVFLPAPPFALAFAPAVVGLFPDARAALSLVKAAFAATFPVEPCAATGAAPAGASTPRS